MIDAGARQLAALALKNAATSSSLGTATVTTASASITAVSLVPARVRKGTIITIVNSGLGDLYVRLSSSNPTFDINDVVIEPGNVASISSDYTGEIRGVWAVAGGSAAITEYL